MAAVATASDSAPPQEDSGALNVLLQGKAQPVDLLLELADIERRLREHIIELVEPIMRKQKLHEARMGESKTILDGLVQDVGVIKRASANNDTLSHSVEAFRVELAEQERSRREREQITSEKVSHHEMLINDLRRTVELKAKEIVATNRTIKDLAESSTQDREELTDFRKYCDDRLTTVRDKHAKLREEFETRSHAVESEQFHLRDRQTNLDTESAHVKALMDMWATDFSSVKCNVDDLWRTRASVQSVEENQKEFLEFSRNMDAHVTGLGAKFTNLVDDVKKHFQTSADVMGHSMGMQIQEIRNKYHEDVKRVDGIFAEIDGFVRAQAESEVELRQKVEQVEEDASRERASYKEMLDFELKKRENECAELGLDLKQVRRLVKEMESKRSEKGGGGGGGPAGNDVLATIVECCLLGAAVDTQDDDDRKSIALFGFKPGAGNGPPGSPEGGGSLATTGEMRKTGGITLPELDGSRSARFKTTPRRRLSGHDNTGSSWNSATGSPGKTAPIVTIDKRCLSCSGSQATVLSGFKLACLHYAPSPVEYQQAMYSRSELIRMRVDLLKQVQAQLRSAD